MCLRQEISCPQRGLDCQHSSSLWEKEKNNVSLPEKPRIDIMPIRESLEIVMLRSISLAISYLSNVSISIPVSLQSGGLFVLFAFFFV